MPLVAENLTDDSLAALQQWLSDDEVDGMSMIDRLHQDTVREADEAETHPNIALEYAEPEALPSAEVKQYPSEELTKVVDLASDIIRGKLRAARAGTGMDSQKEADDKEFALTEAFEEAERAGVDRGSLELLATILANTVESSDDEPKMNRPVIVNDIPAYEDYGEFKKGEELSARIPKQKASEWIVVDKRAEDGTEPVYKLASASDVTDEIGWFDESQLVKFANPSAGERVRETIFGAAAHSVDVVQNAAAASVEAVTDSVEEARQWWDKNRDAIKAPFAPSFWAEKWDGLLDRYYDGSARVTTALTKRREAEDIRLHGTMTPEEVQKYKDRRRGYVMMGVVAFAAANAYLKMSGMSAGDGSGAHGAVLDVAGGRVYEPGSGHASEILSGTVPVAETPSQLGTVHGSGEHLDARAFTPESFTIKGGEGGLELFDKLGLKSADWYASKDDLLKRFPHEFYSAGGDVRLNHTGELPKAVRSYLTERFKAA